jgi:hypothetical protein
VDGAARLKKLVSGDAAALSATDFAPEGFRLFELALQPCIVHKLKWQPKQAAG